jgi:multiple sugar transport system substrate-binding protein
MPRRLVKFVLIGAVVALVLTACGGSEESGGGGAQGTGPITFVAGKDTSGKYPAVINKWNSAHPNEKVSMIELPESADAQQQARAHQRTSSTRTGRSSASDSAAASAM